MCVGMLYTCTCTYMTVCVTVHCLYMLICCICVDHPSPPPSNGQVNSLYMYVCIQCLIDVCPPSDTYTGYYHRTARYHGNMSHQSVPTDTLGSQCVTMGTLSVSYSSRTARV